jgi:hypothetical protein
LIKQEEVSDAAATTNDDDGRRWKWGLMETARLTDWRPH